VSDCNNEVKQTATFTQAPPFVCSKLFSRNRRRVTGDSCANWLLLIQSPAYPDAVFPATHAAAAAAAGGRTDAPTGDASRRGAVRGRRASFDCRPAATTSPVGWPSAGSGRARARAALSSVRRDPCIYMRNLSGIRGDVDRGGVDSGRPSDGSPPRSKPARRGCGALDDGRGTDGRSVGRSDGRREKFNHETFMRRGVLTIRRQIAKRRHSEIIRNLQLTGGAAAAVTRGRRPRGHQTSRGRSL